MIKITLAVATALALVATPALAADESGFYAGAGVGIFGIDVDDNAVDDAIDDAFGDDDTGFRVFGGWQFNRYFGIEAGYDGGAGIDASISRDRSWRQTTSGSTFRTSGRSRPRS